MSDKHYIGLDLTGFEDKGEARPVSRVTLFVDDENVVTAGDDTGLELTGDCPNATQAMVDAILARVKGYKYKMYSATSANLDPAAELGDGVTAGGIYSVISKISDGGDGYPDLDAPGEAEPEDEFPTEGPITKAFNKKISDTRATITKTAEEINLSVENTTKELRASIQVNSDAIEQRVTKNGVIAAINLTSEQATIQASKISLEGLVTVNKTFQIDTQGYLTCTGGKIGGFTITGSSLYNGLSSFSGTTNGVYVGTDGISLGGGKFKVSSTGALTATSANITGTINATSGSFTGTVNATSGSFTGTVNATSGTFTGTVNATDGYFAGTVYANKIAVGGDAGYITGSQIGSGTISGGNIGSGTITGGNIGYQTVGVGNMGTNSIENRCIQSGSIYNSTLSGGCVSEAKCDQTLKDYFANAVYANKITSGSQYADYIYTHRLVVDTGFRFKNENARWVSGMMQTGGSL